VSGSVDVSDHDHEVFLDTSSDTLEYAQYLRQQWTLLLKYIEGPVYAKTIEITEQIQKLSIVIFHQSVHYLNIFFERASSYTAHSTHLASLYLTDLFNLVRDQWSK
jgi:hypothetical protein